MSGVFASVISRVHWRSREDAIAIGKEETRAISPGGIFAVVKIVVLVERGGSPSPSVALLFSARFLRGRVRRAEQRIRPRAPNRTDQRLKDTPAHACTQTVTQSPRHIVAVRAVLFCMRREVESPLHGLSCRGGRTSRRPTVVLTAAAAAARTTAAARARSRLGQS
jgi:hypothetical protein